MYNFFFIKFKYLNQKNIIIWNQRFRGGRVLSCSTCTFDEKSQDRDASGFFLKTCAGAGFGTIFIKNIKIYNIFSRYCIHIFRVNRELLNLYVQKSWS